MDVSNSFMGITPKLTLANKYSWMKSLNMLVSSEGPVGATIIKRGDASLVPIPDFT